MFNILRFKRGSRTKDYGTVWLRLRRAVPYVFKPHPLTPEISGISKRV